MYSERNSSVGAAWAAVSARRPIRASVVATAVAAMIASGERA